MIGHIIIVKKLPICFQAHSPKDSHSASRLSANKVNGFQPATFAGNLPEVEPHVGWIKYSQACQIEIAATNDFVLGLESMVGFHERLVKGAANYHDGSPDERVYGEYLSRSRKISDEFGNFILGFLVSWGSLARIFPKEGLAGLKIKLDQWFVEHERIVAQLSNTRLWQVDLRSIGLDICELFDSLKRVQQPIVRNRKRAFGSTAAGKTLHLLMPDLCVIWDEKVVRKSVGLDGDAWSYLRYLRAQKAILEKAIRDASDQNHLDANAAVKWLERTHRTQRDNITPLSFDEPATKILDEAMYDSDFVSQEVRPLLEIDVSEDLL